MTQSQIDWHDDDDDKCIAPLALRNNLSCLFVAIVFICCIVRICFVRLGGIRPTCEAGDMFGELPTSHEVHKHTCGRGILEDDVKETNSFLSLVQHVVMFEQDLRHA